jgi:hypothetical protein
LAISFRIIGEASTKTKSTYHFYCRCTSGDWLDLTRSSIPWWPWNWTTASRCSTLANIWVNNNFVTLRLRINVLY